MLGIICVVVLSLLVVGALVDDLSTTSSSDGADATIEPSASPPPPPGQQAPPSESPGFEDGTYLVGTDVQPGRYRADGGDFCVWRRLSDVTGDHDAVLAWEFSSGQAYVEILPTDTAFSTDGCGRWEPAIADGPDVSGGFEDGTYLVGSDIQPGTYRSTGGSFCTWERLSDVTGNNDAVLAWELADGQAYAEILTTDVAFRTDDCGTWSRIA